MAFDSCIGGEQGVVVEGDPHRLREGSLAVRAIVQLLAPLPVRCAAVPSRRSIVHS
jgi:hypothetical protein